MVNQFTVFGEEFMQKSSWRTDQITRPGSVDLLLYDDSVDSLGDTDNLSSISTEPGGASYSRQSVNLDSSEVNVFENSSNNFQIDLADQFFDLSDSSSGSVDSCGLVGNFSSSATGGNSGDNLLGTGGLGSVYDLSSVDTLSVGSMGLEQT